MTRLVSTELLKLRVTRSIWGFIAVSLVLAGLRTAMVLAGTGTAAGNHRGTTEATMTIAGAAVTGVVVVLVLLVLSVPARLVTAPSPVSAPGPGSPQAGGREVSCFVVGRRRVRPGP